MNDKSALPGNPDLYNEAPPRVDYYDVFYFETRVRDMIEEHTAVYKKSIKDDKDASLQLRHDYDHILSRLNELECFSMI